MDSWNDRMILWKYNHTRSLPQLFISAVLFLALAITLGPAGQATTPVNAQVTDFASYYEDVFKRLLDDSLISPRIKALTLDSIKGEDVAALKKLGVSDVTGVPDMPAEKIIISGYGGLPFKNDTFDLEFFGYQERFKYWTQHAAHVASEIGRTLKVGGIAVVHLSYTDEYSFFSFINLFTCCLIVNARQVSGYSYASPFEVILRKRLNLKQGCTVQDFQRRIVNELEPLVEFDRPGDWEGPWGNDKATLRYVSTMVDLSFKERYIYIDLGAHTYESSIGMWWEQEYPKQNKPFEIYAVEPDTAYHEEYKGKHALTLIPYAAWLRNETLTFEVFRMPQFGGTMYDRMGHLLEGKDSHGKNIVTTKTVEAFDVTEWLLRTITRKDFVVLKMDVEGDEHKLLDKMHEDGALCLIDDLFVECHYDYPGFEYGPKHNKTLDDCLDLFRKFRNHGYAVHQWW